MDPYNSMFNFSSQVENKTSPFLPVMRINSDGFIDYSEFALDNPPKYEPFEFERVDWKRWVMWTHRHWDVPIYAGVIYIAVIFGIQAVMKNRHGLELKRELFLWNAALGIFSMLGFIRMMPEFLGVLTSHPNGFYRSVCIWQGGNMPTAFWGLLFTWSKFVELGKWGFEIRDE